MSRRRNRQYQKKSSGNDILPVLGFISVSGLILAAINTSSAAPTNLTTGSIDTSNDGVNNPLNIRVSNNAWQGKNTLPGKSFESFEKMWQGYRAGLINLQSIFKAGHTTLTDMISVYAPKDDGNSLQTYVQGIENATGIDPLNDDMTQYINDGPTMQAIITYMAQLEQGANFKVNPADIQLAWNNI